MKEKTQRNGKQRALMAQMSIQQQVARQVAATPPGKIIVSRDFPAWKSAPNGLSKALSRLVASGELARFA